MFFVCLGFVVGFLFCFVFFGRTQKNFKYVKVNALKNEMHNIIVLLAAAVGWTLEEKNERKLLTIPHQSDAVYLFVTSSILSPIIVCYAHLHSVSPLEDSHRSVLA